MAAKIYLWICAIVFIGLGLALVISPVGILKSVDIHFETPTAFADIRADYGGCILGVGVFLAYCATKRLISAGLMCIGLTFCGYVTGRVYSLIVDGMPKQIIFTLIAVEVVGAIVAFGLLPMARKAEKAADHAKAVG